MRPDEHKKKKNAQYKKKHGQVEKESKSDVKQKNVPQQRVEKSYKTANERDKEQVKEVQGKVKQEEVGDEESKHYSRRQIASNWSRYEDSSGSESDEDIPLQRGEDFNKLLAEAGGSASQFRFKDEVEWTEDTQSNTTPIMALDFANLAGSLECVPLHERLGIRKSVFSEDQMVELRECAIEAQKKNPAVTKDMPTSFKSAENVKDSPRSDNTEYVKSNPKQKLVSSAIDNSGTGIEQRVSLQSTAFTKDKKNAKEINVNVRSDIGKEIHSDAADKGKRKEVESLEDDLDMLLSLDETIDKKATAVEEVNKDKKKTTFKTDKEETKGKKESVTNIKGDDKLDDWLDSLLDS